MDLTQLTTPKTKDYDPPCLANFIVVVSAATAVATTVQKFIVVGQPVTLVPYDCTETYRRSYCRLRSLPMIVQKFIVVVIPGTYVTTTVQIFIVVVIAGYAMYLRLDRYLLLQSCRERMLLRLYRNLSSQSPRLPVITTTVQIFIVVVTSRVRQYTYDCTNIYRRSHRGYR